MEPRAYQRFFAELKRRRVFNTAAVYGGVAFVVIQGADLMVLALHLPEVVSIAVAVLAIIGFPLSMILAWTYDVSAGGFEATLPPMAGELEEIVALSPLRRWPVGIAAAVGIALLMVGAWWQLGGKVGSLVSSPVAAAPEAAVRSLAVLPLLNLSGEEEDAYLAEGIAAELRRALGGVPGLQVTAGTPAFASPNGEHELPTLAGRSSGAVLLEGSVRRSRDEVEIAVRLVAAETGDRLWSQSYPLAEEAFLRGLDDIAWSVVDALGLGDPTQVGRSLVRPATESFGAYDSYLRGRYLSLQGTPEALDAAIEYFNRALLLDPEFMHAWSALATAYVLLPEVGGASVTEVLPYAEAALNRAMVPGRETAQGYAASAFLKWSFHWDLQGAESDFLRSIELEPNDPLARLRHAQLLATERRWDEGLAEVDRALELDPGSPQAYRTLGLLLMCAGREGAQEAFRHALELAPTMSSAAFLLAEYLAVNGDLKGAKVEFDRFSSLTGSDPSVYRTYLKALSDPSKTPEAVTALKGSVPFDPVQNATLLAHLGDYDAALNLLERSIQARSPAFPWINALPQYEAVRPDPRFQAILAWIGF